MDRVIALDGCLNFRDLGGYPTGDGRRVRWRRVFRSDALHLLTSHDVARLRDDLGLREVIDLRSTAERHADTERPLDAARIRLHHTPLFDGDSSRRRGDAGDTGDGAVERGVASAADERAVRDVGEMTLADRYVGLAEVAKPAIARVLTLIAESEGPCVFHCAAGKDRTGVISAVLLGVLGVRDEIIVADYAATRENLDAIVARLLSTEGYQTMLSALPADTMHAEPQTMIDTLSRLRSRYGSLTEFARAAGASGETLERLAVELLEG